MAYTASYQRREPILATLISIEQAIKFMVDSGAVQGEYFVVMGFDFGKSRYRKELLGSYKGHRTEGTKEKTAEEQKRYDTFQHQYRHLLPELTKALGVRMLGVEGVEFDDLGSIIANKFVGRVIMLSEDHDMLQVTLDKPLVKQFMPKSYRILDTAEAVVEEGVTNKLEFLVAKAIKGDSGDSIRGIKQCGKDCFNKWFEPLRGCGFTLAQWKDAFVTLAESNKKYKIHGEYRPLGVTSFAEVFDLNIALGETMVDHSHLNTKEQKEFNDCITAVRTYDLTKFRTLLTTKSEVKINEFGDEVIAPTFQYLRGKPDERT